VERRHHDRDDCTLSGNGSPSGGGLYQEAGTLTLINTIVANSTSGGNCGLNALAIPVVSDGGHNLQFGGGVPPLLRRHHPDTRHRSARRQRPGKQRRAHQDHRAAGLKHGDRHG